MGIDKCKTAALYLKVKAEDPKLREDFCHALAERSRGRWAVLTPCEYELYGLLSW